MQTATSFNTNCVTGINANALPLFAAGRKVTSDGPSGTAEFSNRLTNQ